jgi:25S rRNA (uracil2634-N3)-methyltransferase
MEVGNGRRPKRRKEEEEESKRTSVEAADKVDDGDDDNGVPVRDCGSLYSSQVTLHCALRRQCVPCAYKVGSFDVALDQDFCRAIPNQRPEQCPRSKQEQTTKSRTTNSAPSRGAEGTLGYRRNMAVLTVGDGDFTFSLAIARLLDGKAHSGLVATSYESRASLIQVYPGIKDTISELESLGATVCYQVDATRLKETLPETIPINNQFDRIVWNFPCSAVTKGQDGQNEAMESNKALVRDFVANSRHLLKSQGQIHLNHKTKPPFNQWNIDEVAVEASQDDKDNDSPHVYYLGRVVFDRFLLPPYVPRKALHHKSFPAHDACTFVFGLERDGDNPMATDVIDFDESDDTSEPSASALVHVTPNLIRLLRSSFLNNRNLYSRVQTKKTKRQKVQY